MKKILLTMFALFCLSGQAFAAKLVVEALNDYNSKCPPVDYSIKIVEDTTIGENFSLPKGAIINGKIEKNIEAKKLKRDAYFVFTGNLIQYPDNCTKEIFPGIKAKMKPYHLVTRPDGGEIAYDIAKNTAGFFVKGISYGLDFGRGVMNPKEGEGRLKSGVENAYEKSVFSYCSEGEEIFIPTGAHVQMSFSDKTLK